MITFPRIYKPGVRCVIAGQPIEATGVHPYTVGAPVPLQCPRVAFRVVRTMSATPDSATLAVYGLDVPRRLAIQQIWTELGTSQLSIATGYDGITLGLFTGDVRTLQASSLEGAEFVTRASADDGGDAIGEAVIPPGLASTAALDAKTMIDVALACINSPAAYVPPAAPPLIPIVPHPSVATTIASASPAATTLFYAAVSVGKARDLLNEAARVLGARWWIRDSQLFFVRRQLPADPLAVALPRTHWLSEPSEDGAGTITVSTFLDPNLTPGRQVALIGRVAPGATELLRIEAGEYIGDTDSASPFSADLTLRRLKGL